MEIEDPMPETRRIDGIRRTRSKVTHIYARVPLTE